MAEKEWNWKAKDGSGGGLLYESGNWGDLLKILWLEAVLEWKRGHGAPVDYLDPFAGDVDYPLGAKTAFRLGLAPLPGLDFIRSRFIEKGRWPSSASAARLIADGHVEVFDADAGRRGRWSATPGVTVPEGVSGWDILASREAVPNALWLVDPYDFLAEWRTMLPVVIDKARQTAVLVYIYNRAAKNDRLFREYRAFRNALEDMRPDLPKRIGRVAADVFLPQSHHELLFLPGEADCRRSTFDALAKELEQRAGDLAAVLEKAAAVDC